MQFDFPVFDGDHHLYETQESFTRYLPSKYADLFRYVNIDGRTKIVVRGMLSDYIPNPTFEVVARPGSSGPYFAGDNPEGKTLREIMGKPMRAIPAFREPEARLEVLDQQGSAAALIFPTLASLVEVNFLDLPDVTQVLIHAFNQWMLDDWKFNYKDRLYATPIVNPCVVDKGIQELEWALAQGAKVVLLRPGAVAGAPKTKSPFLPEFDPFWARVQESGVLVTLHASDSGYQRYVNDWEGSTSEYSFFKPSTFATTQQGSRPITDTMFSAVCHGMLTRFPGVKLLSVENGGGWVIPALQQLDRTWKKMPQEFPEHPRETFLRQIYVHPFWEESVDDLIDEIGADHVVFGSDWPHAECGPEPADYAANELKSRSAEDIRKIMSDNLYGLMGLKQPA